MIKKDDLLALSRKDELALKSPSNLAFMPYFFVQTNFPYTEVEGREFVRKNGNLTLSLYSPTGLPYGSLPRLVIAFIVTEAIRKKTREVHLGETLSEFLTRIGLGRTGGKNGTITRLRKQLNSLFTCFISCTSNWKHKGGGNIKSIANMLIADAADLWWDPHTLYDRTGYFPFQNEHKENKINIRKRSSKELFSCYNISVAKLQTATGRRCYILQDYSSFWKAVMVEITAYYFCKWLDVAFKYFFSNWPR